MKKFRCIISLLLILSLLLTVSCTQRTSDPIDPPGGDQTPPGGGDGGGSEKPSDPSAPNDDPSNSHDSNNSSDKEDTVLDMVDFTVKVEEGREPVVLQLTDMQIIDASQERSPDRLGSTHDSYWAADKKDERCYDYLREIIEETHPDLILVTGDLVYGEFDDSGESFAEFVSFMESFGIPWAPVFGNHENESTKGVDWQCEQFNSAEHCLFLQRDLTGNGNYTVGIEQGGRLTRVFFMLDSNGCGKASDESKANGHTKTTVGFGADQIEWYTSLASDITESSPETKLSFVFHIQLAVFGDAFAQYATDGSTHVHIDMLENRQNGDFGYIGAAMKSPWDQANSVWNGLKALGVDSVLVGHEHANSASILYDGVRLQYGMKSSTYDRLNYISADGNITSTYYSTDTPWVGGSVLKLATDGSIADAYIYYCKDAGGEIDWEGFKPVPEVAVGGLQKDSMTIEDGISVMGIQFDQGTVAYRVDAARQGKVKIDVSLLKNKSSFTFTVYVPSSSTAKLGGLGEFAIRIKPDEIEPKGDGGTYIGYIDYDSSSTVEGYRIEHDQWSTFVVDISEFDERCNEFAFVIAAGNTIYLRDITIV